MSLTGTPPAPRTIPLTLLVVALLVTAGVAVVGTAAYYELRPNPGPVPSGAHVTVVDDLGRTVVAPVNASRVVVLAPNVMDTVVRLGLRDRVVGVGCTTSIPGGILNEYSPTQTAAWNLTGSLCITDYPSLDTEKVANLSTQLVLASTLTYADDVMVLTDTYHIPVVVLAPSTLAGIVGDVALLAQLFPSTASTAIALEAKLQGILNSAASFDNNLSENGTPIPSVLLTYYFYADGYGAYGSGSFGQSIVALAGGDSISSDLPFEYADLNATVVLADQPSVILYGTSWNDTYLVDGQTPAVWASSAPYWGQLSASKVPVDVTLITEADPTMILTLPWFEHWLYPTLVPPPTA